MARSKLFELLFCLTEKEWNELLAFSGFVIHRLTDKDRAILKALHQLYPKAAKGPKTEEELEKELLATFYPVKAEKEVKKQWNYTKNRLVKMVNQYIVYKHLQKESFVRNQILLEFYHRQQLPKNLSSMLKKATSFFERSKKDYDTEYQNFKLQEILLAQSMGERLHREELQKMNEALDNFYLENKLRMLIEQHNRHRIISEPAPDDFFEEWLQSGKPSLEKVGNRLSYRLYLMMTTAGEVAHYWEAKNLFMNNAANFSADYKVSCCGYLMNQCIFYLHQGQLKFANEYISYVKFLLEEALFLSEGLPLTKYSNTVYMALVAKELEWIKDFVDQYSSLVDHPEMVAIKHLNRANILFYQGQKNNEALLLLRNFDVSETYFKINFDKLSIKLFYEEKLEDTLKSKLGAFQKYLQRSSDLPQNRKEKNFNFIKAVRNLLQHKVETLNLDRNDFVILDYLWLLEKKEEKQ